MNSESRFHEAMLDVYRNAKQECNYKATYFLQLVTDYGGLEAARRLLSGDPASGFTKLWELGRLDLSAEAQMLRPEFSELFTNEELEIARSRLVQFGYEP